MNILPGMEFDAIVIGLGPGGIAASKKLLEENKRILILEMGSGRKHRRCPVLFNNGKCLKCGGICQITSGIGGACSSVSCGILSRYPAGSGLKDILGKELIIELENKILNWFDDIGKDVFNVVIPNVDKQIYQLSNNDDITLKTYQSLSVEGECFEDVMNGLFSEIVRLGADIRFNQKVVAIKDIDGGLIVSTESGQEFSSKNVIIAVGRAGNSAMLRIFEEVGVGMDGVGGYIGLRFEDKTSKALMELRDQVLDPKFKRDGIRLFCFCPEGKVVGMSVQNSFANGTIDSTEGCIWKGSPWGNFSIQKEVHFERVSDYFKWESEFVNRYIDLSGGKLMGQSLKTLADNSPPEITGSSIDGRYVLGSIKKLLGRGIVEDMLKFLIDMDNIFGNKVITKESHVFAPEIHLWPKVSLDSHFQSSKPGLYVIGDFSGVARGIMQAQVMGLRAADGIIS